MYIACYLSFYCSPSQYTYHRLYSEKAGIRKNNLGMNLALFCFFSDYLLIFVLRKVAIHTPVFDIIFTSARTLTFFFEPIQAAILTLEFILLILFCCCLIRLYHFLDFLLFYSVFKSLCFFFGLFCLLFSSLYNTHIDVIAIIFVR